MPVPDTTFIYDLTPKGQILGLDTTIVNIIIVALNLFITLYINFRGYRKRRGDERNYQMQFDLYKALIINNLESFLLHIWKVEELIIVVSNSNKENSEHLKLIEVTFDEIENTQQNFYREKIPPAFLFSKEFGNEIKEVVEKFYDCAEDILSKMNLPLSHRNTKLLSDLKSKEQLYNSCIYDLIKKYQPLP